MKRYAGKAALLTGAGNGIGAATARRLAAEGAQLLLVDLDPAVNAVADALGATAMVCDLSTTDAPAEVAAKAAELFGTVDMLGNIAGIGGGATLYETTDEFFDRMISVNLRAVYRLIREVAPHLSRPGGAIVNISSTLGLAGHPNTGAYAATKGAMAQLTRQLAAELGPEGIRVNAVAPGVIDTQMTTQRVHGNDFYQRSFIHTAALRGEGQPGFGLPDDIAAAIAFLGAEDAGFISAQVLAVDGGWMGGRHPPQKL